ncbi:hypothetical protein [Nocardia wallacei]|uniref:hypothetical protein n=1 Tax=Nocardia wallacei TaxID=480035 RepID=UPI002453C23F|nr:hypothetical protein [Nocardia wallacei]
MRNTLHLPRRTCAVCTGPIKPDYLMCWQCSRHAGSEFPTADRVATMIYAIHGQQSHHLMWQYKTDRPGPDTRRLVQVLALVGAHQHRRCLATLTGRQVTHWATVPSLKPERIGTDHPFRQLIAGTQLPEIEVAANPPITANPRDFAPSNFQITTPIPSGAHILVIDDTWTSGGHAQSVAAALKYAGGVYISFLAVARFIRPDPVTTPFIGTLHPQFDLYRCPWTADGTCP